MKCILFCENAYAFGILAPIKIVLEQRDCNLIWYVSEKIKTEFPYEEELNTSSMNELITFKADAIFVPGNEVPHFLRGVKTQIFHGLAGEKKGHFRIRNYFDLYLTQGPYFTKQFLELSAKSKNFEVVETGWSKLDVYATKQNQYKEYKKELLITHKTKNILLYAPTFSPSLSSATILMNSIQELGQNRENLVLIKFHDLMEKELCEAYKRLAENHTNIIFVDDRNILKYLIISDLMISDTSSVVYEFLLLNKPVITLNSRSPKPAWENILSSSELTDCVKKNLDSDPFSSKRAAIIAEYHPYKDGESSLRMVEAVENYILRNGVPEKRKLSFFRKYKINKMYKQ
tara:strand:- start:570 stop:1604 length:1035 start_codon:yes stop_codon:yes gene_type:complete